MEVCRLCLDLVATQGDAKPLDGETRDMVQVVAPELNLEASKNPSVCSECQKTLSRLFDFKSRVFEHEGEIREKVGDRRGTVSLKAAVTGEADPPLDPDRDKAKDRLCRTCLAPIECESFTVLRPSEPDAYLSSMLDMCLVEVDLALTKDPVMCEGCLDNLQKLHHFKSSCQDVEDKIVDYCNKNKLKESTVVDLHAVLESERPRDIEMLTVKDEDGASGSKIKDEEKEVEPKSEDEDEEMSEDEEEDEEMSEDEEVKQEELDIKSETEPGTSDSDKNMPIEQIFTKSEDPESHNYTERDLKSKRERNITKNLKHVHENISEMELHDKSQPKVASQYFQCSKCTYKSVYEENLKNHEKTVHKGMILYKCSICSANFKSRSKLVLHSKKKHGTEVDIFECSKCNYKTSKFGDLTKHKKSVHGSTSLHNCSICPSSFRSPWKLKLHQKNEHDMEVEAFHCSKCSYKSLYKANVINHEKAVHKGMCLYKCSMCSDNFTSKTKLDLHSKNEHGMEVNVFECSKCSYKTFRRSNLNNHEKSVHEGMSLYTCSMCSASFKSRSKLLLHREKEHGKDVETFQCSKCNYKTIWAGGLARHEKTVHEGMSIIIFKCNICSANFKSLPSLKLHRKNEHGAEVEMFQCSKCNFKSIRKAVLTRHEKGVHEGVCLFKCGVCSANFKSPSKLNLHRKKEHEMNLTFS